MKLNPQGIFDNPLPNIPFPKEFHGCIDYIPSYLPKLEYTQGVNTSTLDQKIPISNPTDGLGCTLGSNLLMRLSVTFWSNKINQSDENQVSMAEFLLVQLIKVAFGTAKWWIINEKIVVWNLCIFFHENFPLDYTVSWPSIMFRNLLP